MEIQICQQLMHIILSPNSIGTLKIISNMKARAFFPNIEEILYEVSNFLLFTDASHDAKGKLYKKI